MPGQAFLRWLCDTMSGFHRPLHRMRVTEGMRQDLMVWNKLLYGFNRVSFWRADICLGTDFEVQTYASGSLGFDIYFKSIW